MPAMPLPNMFQQGGTPTPPMLPQNNNPFPAPNPMKLLLLNPSDCLPIQ